MVVAPNSIHSDEASGFMLQPMSSGILADEL